MWINKRDISVLLFLAVVWGSTTNDSRRVAAQEPNLPRPVKESLDRFAGLKTFALTWVRQYQWGDPENEKSLSDPMIHYLVWQDGKMYTRFQGGRAWTDAQKKGMCLAEQSFNGEIIAAGRRDNKKSSDGKSKTFNISIIQVKDEHPNADYFDVEYLQPMGLHFPSGAGELLRIKQLRSQLLFALEHGGKVKSHGPAQIDGRPLIRIALLTDNPLWGIVQRMDLTKMEKSLRSPATTKEQVQKKIAIYKRAKEVTPRKVDYIFYLDPERGYAVRRWQELTEDGKLQRQAECTDHVKLPGCAIWLPRKCRVDEYISISFPGEISSTPYETNMIEVSEFDTKPVPDELFTLKYTDPGTKVMDQTLPEAKLAPGADLGMGAVTYKIPARPEDLDRAIEAARASTRALAEARAKRESGRWIMLTINATLLAGVLVYIIIRYRRKAARA